LAWISNLFFATKVRFHRFSTAIHMREFLGDTSLRAITTHECH